MRTTLLLLVGLLLLRPSVDFSESPEATGTNSYRIHTVLRGIAVGGIAISDAGDVYATDTLRSRIHRIDTSGNATIIAGVGTPEFDRYIEFAGPRPRYFSGDGGPSLAAGFDGPHGIAVDSKGDIYVADSWSNRIRRISSDGIVRTVGGTGESGFAGDGGPANRAKFATPMGLALDAAGNLFVADTFNNRVRRIGVDGTVTTVAGTGKRGSAGDGKLATKAQLAAPYSVGFDNDGNLYIVDTGNNRLRKVDRANVIHTIAGGQKDVLNRMSELVNPSLLFFPTATALLSDGVVLIGDNFGVRRISPDGSIQPIAGNGKLGALAVEGQRRRRNDLPLGEGDVATTISVFTQALAVTTDGRIYLSDAPGLRVLTPIP